MYPSTVARQLAILLRISRELDIVGDVSATVDNPSELLAWAAILTDATIAAGVARIPATDTSKSPQNIAVRRCTVASPPSCPASNTGSSGRPCTSRSWGRARPRT